MEIKWQRSLTIWALVISLCAVTVAYAALQTTLTISGSVTKKGGNWDIQFTDVAWVAGEKLTTSPAVSGTSLSFGVTLAAPGDYAVIGFKVKNNGTIAARNGHSSGYLAGGQISINNGTANMVSYTVAKKDGITCNVKPTSDISTIDSDGIYHELQYLAAGATSNKVYLMCRYDDVNNSGLSSTDSTISVSYTLNYYQA